MKKLLVGILALFSVSSFASDMICKTKMWEDSDVTIKIKQGEVGDLIVSFRHQGDLYKGLGIGLEDDKNLNITAVVKGEYMSTLLKIKLPVTLLAEGKAAGQMQYLLSRDFETRKISCELK